MLCFITQDIGQEEERLQALVMQMLTVAKWLGMKEDIPPLPPHVPQATFQWNGGGRG